MKPLLLLIAVSLSGCLNAPLHDPGGDEVVGDLLTRTREAVVAGDAERLSLAQSRNFLRRSQATAGALRARAQVSRISAAAQGCLGRLDGEYAMLLGQGRPLRTANSRALRTTLAELQALHPFTAGWRSVPAGDGGATTAVDELPTEDPAQCKKKDDDKKDRHDRRDNDSNDKKDKGDGDDDKHH